MWCKQSLSTLFYFCICSPSSITFSSTVPYFTTTSAFAGFQWTIFKFHESYKIFWKFKGADTLPKPATFLWFLLSVPSWEFRSFLANFIAQTQRQLQNNSQNWNAFMYPSSTGLFFGRRRTNTTILSTTSIRMTVNWSCPRAHKAGSVLGNRSINNEFKQMHGGHRRSSSLKSI